MNRLLSNVSNKKNQKTTLKCVSGYEQLLIEQMLFLHMFMEGQNV